MLRILLCAMAMSLCVALVTPTLASTASDDSDAPRGKTRGGHARLLPLEHNVASGVPFDVSGVVSTRRVKRFAELQREVRGTWRSIDTVTTDRRGRFTFEGVRLSSTTRLRASLPAHSTRVPRTAGGPRTLRVLPAATSPMLAGRVRKQQGRLVSLPALSQQGTAPEAPRTDVVVSASFNPPHPGRAVDLERLDDRAWLPQATQREDASGHAVFNVPPGATYRATARPFTGAARVRTNTVRARTRDLLFEDTFDAASLDARWEDFAVGRGYPGSLRTCALSHRAAHSTGDGTLRLGLAYDPELAGQECRYETPEGTRSSPYLLQTQVATWSSFRFTYGIAAARIKFARTRGRHSGFWIQVGDKVPGDPATGTEIDVVEFFGDAGDGRSRIGSFLHYVGADGGSVTLGQLMDSMEDMKPAGDTWWDSFHVFSVAWTPTEYVFRVDGRETYREDRAISRTPQWLVLSAIASDYELAKITPETIGQTTLVDWVRVWSL